MPDQNVEELAEQLKMHKNLRIVDDAGDEWIISNVNYDLDLDEVVIEIEIN